MIKKIFKAVVLAILFVVTIYIVSHVLSFLFTALSFIFLVGISCLFVIVLYYVIKFYLWGRKKHG